MALDLDQTCTARLKVEDDAREARQLEAASGGLLSEALGVTRSNGTHTEPVREITQANFRDQGL